MQIVIDIPKELYNYIHNNNVALRVCDARKVAKAIANGTPLPKGHGRLIDADSFKQNVCTYQQTGCGSCKHSLCCPEDVPTIIEADKAESEDKCKNCEYYRNPDYTRCHECKAESEE